MDWIEVKDGKPHLGQKVLCVQDPHKTTTKEALFSIYDGKGFTPPKPTYFATFEIGQSRWADVTHWMPLPKTPKQ